VTGPETAPPALKRCSTHPWLTHRALSLVLDEAGEPLGTVLLPANVAIVQSSRSHVWAVERDEYGLASVVRYRMSGLE